MQLTSLSTHATHSMKERKKNTKHPRDTGRERKRQIRKLTKYFREKRKREAVFEKKKTKQKQKINAYPEIDLQIRLGITFEGFFLKNKKM